MAGWREQKREALGDIHRTFEIPAVYITHAAGTPVRANVRLHKKQIVSESPFEEPTPSLLDLANRIIFDKVEVPHVHGKAYVIFGNSEAYLTGPSKPEREGYIWVEVTEVPQADLDLFLTSIDTTGDEWEGILT